MSVGVGCCGQCCDLKLFVECAYRMNLNIIKSLRIYTHALLYSSPCCAHEVVGHGLREASSESCSGLLTRPATFSAQCD
jgi:hypothetical protein